MNKTSINSKIQYFAVAIFLGMGFNAYADSANTSEQLPSKLPKEERAFVDAVGKLNKSQIVALLGEPAKAEDVKLKDSGRVVASIWHYHFINQSSTTGEMYATTELDFIDDNVNVVVFLNNDGTEKSISPEQPTQEQPADSGY